MRLKHARPVLLAAIPALGAASLLLANVERRWLAGDSHVHSHWSPGYDRTKNPPEPLKGRDAIYPTPLNARKAREHGLRWMVTTDHGGPNHSKLNLEHAYEELKQSRQLVPDLLQFYGMELNMPAMDHHTLIIPNSQDEWKTLFDIESRFDANEAWPPDPSRDTEEAAVRALTFMKGLPLLPLVFANHPSRSATGVGVYGLDEPRELRSNNDLAPEVYRGMEGAPGHQAAALAPDGSQKRDAQGRPAGDRGAYGNPGARTFGGFDQMTARVGGLWDALLGEGRRFWILATSDSHANYADSDRPGSDFWPGQYQKTYVKARPSYDDVLDGIRAGRMFVASGDLVSELDVRAAADGTSAEIGGTLGARSGAEVTLTVSFRDPAAPNASGDRPSVRRVDVIVGRVTGPPAEPDLDRNKTTSVVARLGDRDWRRAGEVRTASLILPRIEGSFYVRIRGTASTEEEPAMDPPGENPWSDLWFYSNPIFVDRPADRSTAGAGQHP
jgi:hypothetical protein